MTNEYVDYLENYTELYPWEEDADRFGARKICIQDITLRDLLKGLDIVTEESWYLGEIYSVQTNGSSFGLDTEVLHKYSEDCEDDNALFGRHFIDKDSVVTVWGYGND